MHDGIIYLVNITDPENTKTIGKIDGAGRISKIQTNGEYLLCIYQGDYWVIPVEDAVEFEVDTTPTEKTSPTKKISIHLITMGILYVVITGLIQRLLRKKRK
jgi:hypothetical protein